MKPTRSSDHDALRRYLLGGLPEEEQERLEERTMLDDDFAHLRDEVELELVDDYAAGILPAEDRRDFQRFYLITPGRRDAVKAAYLSRVYRERIAAATPSALPAPVKRSPALRMLVIAALVAGLTLVMLGGAWLLTIIHRGSPASQRTEAKSTPAVRATAPSVVASRPKALAPPLAANPPASVRTPKVKHAPRALDSEALTVVIGAIDADAVRADAETIFGQEVNVSEGVAALLARSLRQDARLHVTTKENQALAEAMDKGGLRLSADVASFGEQKRDAANPTPRAGSAGLFYRLPPFPRSTDPTPPRKPPVWVPVYPGFVVVTIKYRLADLKTGGVVETGEVQGYSKTMVKDPSGLYAGPSGAAVDMKSKAFARTPVGEATLDACRNLADVLKDKAEKH